MKGRINIQYTIEIEQLGEEIERLSKGAIDRLARLASQKRPLPTDSLTYDFHDYVDSIRQELAAVDISLAETNHLVGSYLSYKAEQISNTEEPAAEVPGMPEMQANGMQVNDLHNKIERFKQALEAGDGVQNDNADQG